MALARSILVFAILLLCGLAPAYCGKRVALVIGNRAYKSTPPLANPTHDANAIAVALESLGFAVILGTDLGKAAMDAKILAFAAALPGAEVAVFFYSGHGLQSGSANYLVPVDAKIASAATLSFETVRLQDVQQTMEREAATSILFLDACRDNPLARNLAPAGSTRSGEAGRGLAPVESGAAGTVISFSTEPGNVALDGKGNNSPYTSALVRLIGTPGEEIMSTLMEVRKAVRAATNGRQTPWEHSALVDKFYFKPAPPAKEVPQAMAPVQEQEAVRPAVALRTEPSSGAEAASIEQIGGMQGGGLVRSVGGCQGGPDNCRGRRWADAPLLLKFLVPLF